MSIRRSRTDVAGAPFTGQIEILRLVLEELPHVRIQLPLDAPGVPGRGGEQEDISLSKSCGCVFSAIVSISHAGTMPFKESINVSTTYAV
jgi:hypothetical protein